MHNLFLSKLCPIMIRAASIEVNLGHTREARWTYQQATDALPHSLSLWIDVSPAFK